MTPLSPRYARNLARADARDAAHPEPVKPPVPEPTMRQLRTPSIAIESSADGALWTWHCSMSSLGRAFGISQQGACMGIKYAITHGTRYRSRLWRLAESPKKETTR